jgi:PAS domain S-box-containing protein
MDGTRGRVLLVEDDEIDRIAVERLFKKKELPYDLIVAGTVAEALLQLQEGRPELVLIDYHLPDGSGLELQRQAGETPCIIITAITDQTVAIEALRAGAYDFIVKDDRREYLELLPTLIEKTLNRRRAQVQLNLQEHIINNLNEMVLLINGEGELFFVNEVVEQLLGYKPAELFGDGWWETMFPHPNRRHEKKAAAARARGEDAPLNYDRPLRRKDGSTLWTSWSESQRTQGELICVGHDITARKEAEESLRRTAISRAMVGQMLRDVQEIGHLSAGAMLLAGVELAERIAAETLPQFLDTFRGMGLGDLTMLQADEARGRWLFQGEKLVECQSGQSRPTDHYSRGFLCGAISMLHEGTRAVGEEIACQSMGDAACQFMIQLLK